VVSAPGCGARVLVGLLATKRRGPARTNQYTITRPWGKGEAFGRIPNWIFVRPELSRQARYLYCDLVRRKNEARQAYCCPKQQALAASVGTAPRTVRRWLQELEEAGLLHIAGPVRVPFPLRRAAAAHG